MTPCPMPHPFRSPVAPSCEDAQADPAPSMETCRTPFMWDVGGTAWKAGAWDRDCLCLRLIAANNGGKMAVLPANVVDARHGASQQPFLGVEKEKDLLLGDPRIPFPSVGSPYAASGARGEVLGSRIEVPGQGLCKARHMPAPMALAVEHASPESFLPYISPLAGCRPPILQASPR